jgi:2-methylisocitrate lyase-like PEP mutase family enzyme
MPEPQRMTTRLKNLFTRLPLFVLAGSMNPIGAKMAESLDYKAFYMSGGNTSAHQILGEDRLRAMEDKYIPD